MTVLDFEQPIYELEVKIEELKNFGSDKNIELDSEVSKLQQKLEKMKRDVYSKLTTWQRIQIARHPDRPYTLDYIRMMTTDFVDVRCPECERQGFNRLLFSGQILGIVDHKCRRCHSLIRVMPCSKEEGSSRKV